MSVSVLTRLPEFSDPSVYHVPVTLVGDDQRDAVLGGLDARAKAWADVQGFKAGLGHILLVPDADGGLARVLFGLGNAAARRRGRLFTGDLVGKLPAGDYAFDNLEECDALTAEDAVRGWLLGSYRFDRYKTGAGDVPRVLCPEGVDPMQALDGAIGAHLAQELINIPTSDMGPDALEQAARDVAEAYDAKVSVIAGDDLLAQNFPLIHAVGRAGIDAPRLVEINWGDAEHPTVTLVGKGIVFDTGGLNIKPGASMGLMKKDMGGAANTIALARMIMAAGLNVRLRVLLPIAENAIAGNAFRPGDILRARNGKTVEVNNTDAEGRLVLADALAYAAEKPTDITLSLATLTGAARVALGPDVHPFFADDDELAGEISVAATRVEDPLWRLPFWAPYEGMIEPGTADLDNAPSGGFAGAITAALFLRRFAGETNYAHFDVYGWTPVAKSGRAKGGACHGARALFDMLAKRYG